MTLEEVQAGLVDRRTDKVAQATSLHYNTVREIRDNIQSNPTYRVLKALSDYLEGKQ